MSLSARLSGQTTESDLSDIWQGAPTVRVGRLGGCFRIDLESAQRCRPLLDAAVSARSSPGIATLDAVRQDRRV